MTSKATQQELSELHGAVAKALKANLDDPKVLAQAISFLKNNSITVDELETNEKTSLFTTINSLVTKPSSRGVEELLELHTS